MSLYITVSTETPLQKCISIYKKYIPKPIRYVLHPKAHVSNPCFVRGPQERLRFASQVITIIFIFYSVNYCLVNQNNNNNNNNNYFIIIIITRGSSVGIALGYGLNDRGSRARFPATDGNFSLRHRVPDGSGAHPASYSMGTRGSFLGCKATGACS
jgi:hypothetical protein